MKLYLCYSYLYGQDVSIQSLQTAFETLYAALKYQCAGLLRLCVTYLDSKLDDTTVLEIYKHVYLINDPILLPQDVHENSPSSKSVPVPSVPIPSAPPLESDDAYGGQTLPARTGCQPQISQDFTDAIIYCGALHYNCLLYIDKHASDVLKQEKVEDLDHKLLRLIAGRENLELSSELILFDALERWCNRKCKEKGHELTTENKRDILGDEILFCVRYPLMSCKEFQDGPLQSGLLKESELSIIFHSPPVPPEHLESDLPQMKTPRGKACGKPNHLSQRTAPIITQQDGLSSPGGSSTRRNGRWGKKKDGKKLTKQKSKSCSPDRNGHKRSTGECIAEHLFRALSCIFD